MPRVITSSHTVETVHGEITVNLNLTITINQDGTVQVAPTLKEQQQIPEKEVPDSIYAIPEFEATELLQGFGD